MTDKPQPTKFHPIQIGDLAHNPNVPVAVTLRAYEVYCHVFGEQKALIEGSCRGGFGAGELIAFLYARTFPQDEWRVKFEEALHYD